ncbi:MAG: efflux RND transporter periplasmic adaptor subunit [Candidatus Omnitrophota bacterium]|nr:MAG: efflux RND transporter periplasmic adaptor subunit [Candidatus Omnitrophota bacterium]
MLKNKYIIITLIIISMLALVFFIRGRQKASDGFMTKEMHPVVGDIRLTVITTGVVEPQNRLEIKPSISGRIEEILVREGDNIKKGDVLALMSSTERAALVDAARSQGEETLRYWKEVYKQTPIISPIDGEVIVRAVEPGQTVTTSDAVLVLSDRLIVSAQFDETDIGRVAVGQEAVITLDAYPDVRIQGVVDHIAYESELISNVNIYDVDILPQEIPAFFRSGMSANVEVIEKKREGVILIPAHAVNEEEGRTFVKVVKKPQNTIKEREIEIGLSDERNVEVISGLTTADVILLRGQVYSLKKKSSGINPFMPFRGRKK